MEKIPEQKPEKKDDDKKIKDTKKDDNNNPNDMKDDSDFLLNLIKNSFLEGKEKEKEKKTSTKLSNTESSFLSSSITKLQTGDDMDIMSELMLLCEQLSLSSDQIGDNPNMPKLLEEVCKNLEKIYLPEIIIYSLQCINYILDINPGLTSVIKRIGAIPKIIMLISAMEDTACLELIVSIFEKISFENSFLLLENNAFLSLLNVIDFLAFGQRKSIMKTCLNISANSITSKQFDLYIKPALEQLCSLTKFSEDNSYINEKAILIFHNIIIVLNQGFYFNNNPELEAEISKYSFMNNLCEILKLYFIEDNKKITTDLVRKILKIINIMFQVSKKETDKLLSIGFLEIVVEIIHHEFSDVISNDNNKISIANNSQNKINRNPAKSSASFYNELFLLLTSLFPDVNKKESNKKEIDEKIFRKENLKYYDFLAKNIIKPLIDNIMHKSSCSTLINLIKLILVFSKKSSKEYIEEYINPKQMAQIISKLLDTKYEPYVNDLLAVMEIFMTKTPEHFIKNFIREGIVENIKNYYNDKDNKDNKESDKKKIKKEKDIKEKDNKEKDKKDKDAKDKDKEDSFSDILDNENNNYSDGFLDNDNDYNDSNENINENDNDNENDEIDLMKDTEEVPKKSDDENKNKNKEEPIKKDEPKKKEEKEENIEKFEIKFSDLSKEMESKGFFEKHKLIKEILEKTKKLKNKEAELSKGKKVFNEIKIKEFIDKYLTDEKIKSYLEKVKFKELINLKDKLISLEKELKEAIQKDQKEELRNVLTKILLILSEPNNEITLFELESSGILIGLCNYFEPIFKSQYDKLNIENDNELQKNINLSELIPSPIIKNEKIYDKTKLFLDCLKENKNKLINYIKLLEYSITSMNCFTMQVDTVPPNYNLNVYYNQSLRSEQKISLRVIYSDEPYKEKVENNKSIDDIVFMEKMDEYNKALIAMKEVKFLLNNNSVFDDMSSVLLSNSNVTLVANENYDVIVVYFLKLKVGSATEKFEINENWGYRDLKKELLKKYGRKNGPNYFNAPIYFGIDFKKKDKTEKKEEKEEEKDINKKIIDFIEYLEPFADQIKDYNTLLDFNKISFVREYHTNIIYSKSLYEIKRLMPSLFLLSITYLSIKKYHYLFGINEDWFDNQKELDELFVNSKVNLLISKASTDGNCVSKSAIPSWCKNLSIDCGFLTKFEFRSLLFKVSFDQRRSLINLQNYFKSIDPNYPNEYNITLEKSMRLKIKVERDKILEHGFTLLNDAVTSKFFGFLEFEYIGEIGNGLGPTLEFFSLIFEKLKEDKNLWYKTTDGSWYPNIGLNENENALKMFKLLGYIVGRAIHDDRLIDIPLSRLFWNLLLERPVLFEDIKIIDKDLYKTLNDFTKLIKEKKSLIEKEPNIKEEEIENKILYNNTKLNSLDLYFTFPGSDIELKKDGANTLVTINNLEEYVNLIYDYLFYKGVSRVTTAFRDGFCLIYSIYNLKCFTSLELEEYICGSLEVKWDENTLYENIKPEHGYTKNSRIFNDLIKFMCSLDKFGQRQFLIFTTGTSRLPIGGFKALSPKLTIVKKTFDIGDIPDNYLPTVMTCQNYLKLPEYSSYDILKDKLLLAMKEGGKEFNLS